MAAVGVKGLSLRYRKCGGLTRWRPLFVCRH